MKLATLIIFSTISLVSASLTISSYIALTSFSDELEKTVSTDLTISISNAMDKIDRTMNARIIDIQFLTSPSNLNLVGNNYSTEEKIDYLRDFEAQTQVYTFVSIYDLNGIKIGDTRNLKIGLDESEEPFFLEASQGKIYHDTIPIHSESLGVSVIHFSGPLYDDNDNINGVLVLRFSLSKINDILDQDTIYSKPIEVHLLSNEGLILYSNHPQIGYLTEVTKLSIFQNFLQSTDKSISFFDVTDEGHDSLFVVVKQQGFLQHKGDDWVLAADIPSNILFVERDQAAVNFVIFAGIILSIAIFASYIMARKITIPIKKLRIEMKKVEKSNFNIDRNMSGSEEIKSMFESFITMTDEIKNSHKKIETQVSELQKIDLQKDEFASMISHELKTPLTPILMWCEVLKDPNLGGTLSERQTEAISTIEKSAKRLNQLIKDLLEAHKIGLGQIKYNYQKFDLNKLFEDVKNEFEFLFKSKNIQFTISNSENLSLTSDEDKIKQIISALLFNAIDFVTKNDGKIEINASEKDGSIVFSVEDNGVGISKENISHLFKKFYQVDASYSRQHGGTGLGLAVVKGLTEGLGGKVWVKSDVGVGSTFYFSIPINTARNR
ncbi:MAG: sensor histidine kinase [Thaumarchaeota archaeon]|nr:sensor histidine kinase [Nitrososphaerota archaeon]